MKKYNWDGESMLFVRRRLVDPVDDPDLEPFTYDGVYLNYMCINDPAGANGDLNLFFLEEFEQPIDCFEVLLTERVELNEIDWEDLLPSFHLPENLEFDDVVCDSVSSAFTQLHSAIIESNNLGLTDVWKPTGTRLVELKDE